MNTRLRVKKNKRGNPFSFIYKLHETNWKSVVNHCDIFMNGNLGRWLHFIGNERERNGVKLDGAIVIFDLTIYNKFS